MLASSGFPAAENTGGCMPAKHWDHAGNLSTFKYEIVNTSDQQKCVLCTLAVSQKVASVDNCYSSDTLWDTEKCLI